MRIVLVSLLLFAAGSASAQDLHLGDEIHARGRFCSSPNSVLAVLETREKRGNAAAERLFANTPGCGLFADEPTLLTDVIDSRQQGTRQIAIIELERESGEVVYTAISNVRVIGGP